MSTSPRLALLAALSALAACASATSQGRGGAANAFAEREADRAAREHGIEIVGLRSTAAGHMLDFRFRVVDPEKAAPLLSRRSRAQLVDPESGRALEVPVPPKIGPLRTTTASPEVDRTYFVLFGNRGGVIPVGRKVTVVIGDFRAPDLVVE
jgi:hypothetical protein